ncbi:Sodium bicarbonate transporter-like protein 11 [Halotydeus destructor]|nr:Sodium bicarbonate transporter-like protein 11 [Halotydeus destructor]
MWSRRLALEIVPLVLLIAIVAYFEFFAKPVKRGFWCNDQTIRYPFKPETISYFASILLTAILVPLVNYAFLNKNWAPWRASFWTSYITLNFAYYFGHGLTMLTTDVIKVNVGRLRPCFMDLCRPEPYSNQAVCRDVNNYITDYSCSVNLDEKATRELGTSFLSGHSSLITYATVYLVLVWQRRLHEDHHTILRLVLQVAAICSCLWASLTRLTDNQHHWEDIVAGICLGATIAVVIDRAFLFLLRNHETKESKPFVPYDELSCPIAESVERKVFFIRSLKGLIVNPFSQTVNLLVITVTSCRENVTRSSFELGHTLATVLSDKDAAIGSGANVAQETEMEGFLQKVLSKGDKEDIPANRGHNERLENQSINGTKEKEEPLFSFCTGIIENVKRRLKYYASDYTDGIYGDKTIHKVMATTFFLYFICILSSVALGVLNSKITEGKIDADRAIFGQAIGGLIWALIAGQPFVIIATTAPLSICNKIVFDLSQSLNVDFYTMYAWVGLWNAAFCALYGIFGVSGFIRFSTRSIEEIFCMFSVVCFGYAGIKDLLTNFSEYYFTEACVGNVSTEQVNLNNYSECHQENSLLYLTLTIGTFWLALKIYNLKERTILNSTVREVLSDYALPLAVILLSLAGTFLFRDVHVEYFTISGKLEVSAARLTGMDYYPMVLSAGLGFAVSLLFFMDQGISARMVDVPNNKLKKGNAHHVDFVWVAIINGVLSIYGLPWMNGLLPHSPLHVRSLADYEKRVERGRVREVVARVRETRLPSIFCHVLIGVTATVGPVIFSFLPVPVLNGLFLYCAASLLRDNSFADRLALLVTEESKCPPTQYVRKCTRKVIHLFTLLEFVQFAILTFIGYAPWPVLSMMYPIFLALLIPIRWYVLPLFIKTEHLDALENYSD